MGIRDEMFRAKVLIFMVPLVLPIGQPPARATDGGTALIECAPQAEGPVLAPVIVQTTPAAIRPINAALAPQSGAPVTE